MPKRKNTANIKGADISINAISPINATAIASPYGRNIGTYRRFNLKWAEASRKMQRFNAFSGAT